MIKNDIQNEQICIYFIYRHLLTSLDGLDKITKTFFALLSVFVINAISQKNQDFANVCRMYSAEIEYSSENLNQVFDALDSISVKSKMGVNHD